MTSSRQKLKSQVKKMPLSPGVYFFLAAGQKSAVKKHQRDNILYIGRATSLRRRVANYFRPDLEPRIAEMVSQAKTVKFQKTDTVLDAVILEANLIKKHWPKYNIKDKDDRSFVYVVIPRRDFTYPLVVRGRELKKFLPAISAGRGQTSKAKIFGPYQNATLLQNALRLIRRIFPYGTCRPATRNVRGQLVGQPCFDYQIGLCPGGCVGKISAADYGRNIQNLSLLLAGQKKQLLKKLKKENPGAARALNQLQDAALITADELAFGGASASQRWRLEAYDISHLSGRETVGAMTVMENGTLNKNEYRLFNIKTAAAGDDLAALTEIISRRLNHKEWCWPDLILVDGGRPQVAAAQKVLAARQISVPLIGLSKFGGDRLVFGPGVKKSARELAAGLKPDLLKLRDEAHRFSNAARRRQLRHR